jgi:hypothetical protein
VASLAQIRRSVEDRVEVLETELFALQSALAAIRGGTANSGPSTGSTTSSADLRRSRTSAAPRKGRSGAAEPQFSIRLDGRTQSVSSRELSAAPGNPASPADTEFKTGEIESGKSVEKSLALEVQEVLGDTEHGLSAIAISKRSHAGYSQVLAVLRALESAGRVSRSGARRTSLWRLTTNEDHQLIEYEAQVAERAAELARLNTRRG